MEPFELPFGGMFDFNRDGAMDPSENAFAYMVINDMFENDSSDDCDDYDDYDDSDDDDD